MARIKGVNLPDNKKIPYGLTYIHGIGLSSAVKVVKSANIDPDKRIKDLTSQEINTLQALIDQNYVVEGELRQQVFQHIKRLKDIRSYRGLRHRLGLPTRGQRTRTNAVTRKGKNLAVGGLKVKLTKT